MVDASAVVSFAVRRLGDFLIQEAVSLQGVTDEVKWLQNELKMMQSFLKDAEEKQEGDARVREWISQIRDVANDTEDVIDTFILKAKVGGTPKRGFLASVKKYSCIVHKGIDLYYIGKEIEALKKRVVEISRRRGDYGIKNIGDVGEGTRGGATGNLRHLRRSSPYEDEDHVVGFEDVTASLVEELLKQEPRRWVISILGMGGLGKTTLARKLYHHGRVEGKFEHHAWVCVSQEYRIQDILQRIIKSFKKYLSKEELEMLEKMTEEDLERHLREFLDGRRYMLVIDDVWHKEAWEILRRAFPDNSNGSRVIITTRIKAVAERSDERTYVHELRFLRPDEGWELFCKKAFRNHNASGGNYTSCCPPNLQMLGSEMVGKCLGLPLAIIVLGGLLSRKQPHEWHMVKENIWQDLKNDSIHISQLLALSFNDLPSQLKPCFLYLGLFPEDFEIKVEKLTRLWVAEGLILPGEEILEEVAEDWLNELIGRSLIQVARRSWMKITYCRVHDLLRDLAVKKAKELNFLNIYDEIINSTTSSSCTAPPYRRQAVHSLTIERYVPVDFPNPCLRSLLFPTHALDEQSSLKFLRVILKRFRLLRVLDLIGIRCHDSRGEKSLPGAIGELIHLRYLGLGDTGVVKLPPSVVNLQALQTLSVHRNTIVKLQGYICKLKQLRHLVGRFIGPLRVDLLTNLQTLKYVEIRDWMKSNPVNLINLRELRITANLRTEQKRFTWDPIGNLRNLQSLSVDLPSPMYFPSIQPLSNCQHLLQLFLSGRIESLPEQMHECLPNLKLLLLRKTQLMQDPMPTLEKLPNLMILELRDDNLKKLTCTATGFPQLEVLVLEKLDCLKELEVEDGAIPMLKSLQIYACCSFTVPERLRSILNSNYLNWDMNWVHQHWDVGITS